MRQRSEGLAHTAKVRRVRGRCAGEMACVREVEAVPGVSKEICPAGVGCCSPRCLARGCDISRTPRPNPTARLLPEESLLALVEDKRVCQADPAGAPQGPRRGPDRGPNRDPTRTPQGSPQGAPQGPRWGKAGGPAGDPPHRDLAGTRHGRHGPRGVRAGAPRGPGRSTGARGSSKGPGGSPGARPTIAGFASQRHLHRVHQVCERTLHQKDRARSVTTNRRPAPTRTYGT